MSEKYKLIDIINYINKDGKKTCLAVVYIVKGNSTNLKNIVVSEEKADILEQYLNADISDMLFLDYDSFNNNYRLKIKDFS